MISRRQFSFCSHEKLSELESTTWLTINRCCKLNAIVGWHKDWIAHCRRLENQGDNVNAVTATNVLAMRNCGVSAGLCSIPHLPKEWKKCPARLCGSYFRVVYF